jgi:hypothetical protein
MYNYAIANLLIPDRAALQTPLSLISTTSSLFDFLQYPARLPCRVPHPADFNGFDPASGSLAAIFPVGREFSPLLAFASARRQ